MYSVHLVQIQIKKQSFFWRCRKNDIFSILYTLCGISIHCSTAFLLAARGICTIFFFYSSYFTLQMKCHSCTQYHIWTGPQKHYSHEFSANLAQWLGNCRRSENGLHCHFLMLFLQQYNKKNPKQNLTIICQQNIVPLCLTYSSPAIIWNI